MNFIIDPKVYPSFIMVSIGESDKTLKMVLDEWYGGKNRMNYSQIMGLSTGTRGRCIMFPDGLVVIRLKKLKDKAQLNGVIAHEALHAVIFILHRMGVKLKVQTSDEVYAYLLGFIVTEIHKWIK